MQAKFVTLFVIAVCGIIVAIATWDSVQPLAFVALAATLLAVGAGVIMDKDPHNTNRTGV